MVISTVTEKLGNIKDVSNIRTSKTSFPVRIQKAVAIWEKYARPMCECRRMMYKHWANGWYSGASTGHSPQPFNLIDMAVSIILPFLVGQNPKVLIESKRGLANSGSRSFAKTLELALSHLFDEIRLEEYTLSPVVMDALFGMGIAKTGITRSHKVEIEGYLHDVGQPYCDRIDFDDYIGDVAARNRQEMKIEGHWYRLPYRYVKESGLYKNTERLSTDLKLYDSESVEEVAKAGVSHSAFHELNPTIKLMDIWLPLDDLIVTLPAEGQGEKFLREVEWDGPEGGPFDTLIFKSFPGSVVPIPPVHLWLDLNKTINEIIIKMRDDVQSEKRIGIYDLAAAEDAERVKNTVSGEMCGVSGGAETVKELHLGGFNEINFPFLQFLLNWFSRVGPNLALTGGRERMAGTLGQEQLLFSNATRELDYMSYQVSRFTKNIVKKLSWFLWNDPLIQIPVIKRVAGIDVPSYYSEETKEGDYLDYTFDIEPYSMTRMNPDQRFQKLMGYITGYILPTLQVAASQGTVLDVKKAGEALERYLQVDSSEWYKSTIPQRQEMNPYQMQQSTKGGTEDNRLGISQPGEATGSNMNNLQQQQQRAAGVTTGQV